MDLLISGLALSYQWWPTLKDFEESLIDPELPAPGLVEPFGEVISRALEKSQPLPGSRISLICGTGQAELGSDLPRLERSYGEVIQHDPGPGALVDQIRQAADLIRLDSKHHGVICHRSQYGSTALVISHPNHPAQPIARLRSASFPGADPSEADLVLVTEKAAADGQNVRLLLQELFRERRSRHPVALGGSRNASSLSAEIFGLVETVLAVKNNAIPAFNQKHDPLPADLDLNPLYFNREYRPWLSRGADFERSALLLCQNSRQELEYLILSETEQPARDISIRVREGSDPCLYPISGADLDQLLTALAEMEKMLADPVSLKSIAHHAYASHVQARKPFLCSLLARDQEDLLKELHHAISGVKDAFQTGKSWLSPSGSCFTPNPLGPGGIAFVYPGAFNSYPGMGRELFHSFPDLADAAGEFIPNLSHSLAEEFLYLRSSRPDAADRPEEIMAEFYRHPTQLIESGISLSVLHTLILNQVFNLKPQAALGYSLGEISMLWANRIWQNAEQSSKSWMNSTLFKDQLFGEMKAVREYWKDEDLKEDFWGSYILKAERGLVKEICDREPLAFLSITNAPNEVVIVGEKHACQRVIRELGCRSLPMPFKAVIHNPAMLTAYPAFVELYCNPTSPRSDIKFFSAADYGELSLTETALAESMARMTTSPIDFPKLVESVYRAGIRIFIEVGPLNTCSRWIGKILTGKPHAAAAINKKYQPDLQGVLKVISLLLSHGVEINLEALHPDPLSGLSIPETAIRPETKPDRSPRPQAQPEAQGEAARGELVPPTPGISYFDHLDRISAGLAQSHSDYLKQQQVLTRNLARVMRIQASSLPGSAFPGRNHAVLFTREQIQAFTLGDHRDCFGSTYSGFGSRRIPRLPNGDLQLLDRVTSIQGFPEQVRENSSLTGEYDLPARSWYRLDPGSPLPHVAIMEIALQPCGFLSAYMGSILGRESQDLYFRNLDGQGTLLAWPANEDNTITSRVQLLSSSSLGDVIIQNYSFELIWGGTPFYKGTSSFGYFPQLMLENQSGLDASQSLSTWRQNHPGAGDWVQIQSAPRAGASLASASLPEISRLWISRQGGNHARGYLFLEQELLPEAWFYRAHFYQDPVMPGSLGVETMARALMAGSPHWGLPPNLKWRIKPGQKTTWKYRGQITPDINQIQIEIHLKELRRTADDWEIHGDGYLWKGSKLIYRVEDLSLESC